MIEQKIVDTALKYIGQTEKPANSGFNDADFERRMKDVGWEKGLSWCSFFAELCYKEAYSQTPETAALDKLFSGSATTTFKNFDLAKNGWTTGKIPKPGSLAVWRYGVGWQGHIGIVISSTENNFQTVEGNTNDKGGREGYIVAQKTRFLRDKISANGLNLIGFVYPKHP